MYSFKGGRCFFSSLIGHPSCFGLIASIIARLGRIVNGAALVDGGAGQIGPLSGQRLFPGGEHCGERVVRHISVSGRTQPFPGPGRDLRVGTNAAPGGIDIRDCPRKLQAALEHSGGHGAHERALCNLLRRGIGGVRVINGPLQIGGEDGGKRLLAALACDIQGPADQGACLDRLGNLLHLAAAQAGNTARDALNGCLQGPGGRAKGQRLPGVRPLRFRLAGRVARRLEAEQRPAYVLPAGNRLGGVEPLPCCGNDFGRTNTGEHLHDGLSDAGYILRPLAGPVPLTDAILIVPRDAVLQEGVGVAPGPL